MIYTNSIYERQIILPQIQELGQEKLKNSHVLIVGAGGLGSPTLINLASLGIGKITIIDYDTVSLSNLNRQFLYSFEDIESKKTKAELAKEKLSKHFPHIEFIAQSIQIDSTTIQKLFDNTTKFDCILLCLDSIETRLLINTFALEKNIPLLDAGVDGFYGYIFCVSSKNSACLACMNNEEKAKEIDKKNQINKIPALAPTCGIIASILASTCLNLLLGMENPYKGILLQYDGIKGEFEKIPLQKNPSCLQHQ